MMFILLLMFYIGRTLWFFPHFISYANELAGTRERLFEKFDDSNIDWGQSLPDVSRFVEMQQPTLLLFSYFGRADAGVYGLPSPVPWGGYQFNDICAFHPIQFQNINGPTLVAISVSNWHGCGYSKLEQFSKNRVREVVGDSILIFNNE